MKPSVVVVGSFNHDLTFYLKAFPRPGESLLGELRPGPGGKGFNQAMAANRAGARALFIGAIGRDAAGAEARQFARAARLRAHFVEKKKEPTGAALITVDAAGQNQVVVALGANLALHRQDVPVAPLRAADVVVCQGESDVRTVAHVLKVARAAGALTVLNPAPMHEGFDLAVLRHTDVLIPNETEFAALAARLHRGRNGSLSVEALRRLPPDRLHALCRSLGVPVVIVTMGDRGCFVSEPQLHTRIQAHDVEPIDTTGAGDAFVGGFAAGLVKFRRNVCEAAHFANAVAALAVTLPGTAAGMPTAREIARFLRRRDHA
ncbi:MAG TPA: ribokinase [Opitutaceae bacterium]|nr:ribokinase [Opitutaceae bacterium]